jgi:hypothetical protein
VFVERASIRTDVHARSVVAAVGIVGLLGAVFKRGLTPSHAEVLAWASGLFGRRAVVYDGPTGLGLARTMIAAGSRCEVDACSSRTARRPIG